MTLEVLEPPSVDRLYFWAVQASFLDGVGSHGAGHLGLQWNPRFPGHTAVNWGGYATRGTILPGSGSLLPSTPRDMNTRDFPWLAGRKYSLRIYPSPELGWRGEVTDIDTGVTTVVRDLHAGGDHLGRVVVWTELFCECSDPRTVVAWSEPVAITLNGDQADPQGPSGQLPGRWLPQHQRLLRRSSCLPGNRQRADYAAGLADDGLTGSSTDRRSVAHGVTLSAIRRSRSGHVESSHRWTCADVERVDHLPLAAVELGETDLEATGVEHTEDLSQSPDAVGAFHHHHQIARCGIR